MDPLVSVILPTYNRAYVLWRAVQSVLAQTEERWDLLVVDDGSSDDTLRLMEEFHDPRVRVMSVAHAGASAARNHGAREARAPYLAYIDSDNVWHPGFLEVMLDAVCDHPDGVLWYCGQRTTTWLREASGSWLCKRCSDEPRAQYGLEDVMRLQAGDTNCQLHLRRALLEIGGWDEACDFIEDWDVFARFMVRWPVGVHWVPRILVDYRQVFGANADGLCAAVVADPTYAQSRWQYLVDKWRLQPGFEPLVAYITERFLQD